jgi:TPR repeat protein
MITDIDLSRKFGNSIYEDYEIAVEFLTVNPDFSLMKFRKVLEYICEVVADKNDVNIGRRKLVDQIVFLSENDCIDKGLTEDLHAARSLCNTGVHKSKQAQNTEDLEFQKKSHQDLVAKAQRTRSIVLRIFEKCYQIVNSVEAFPDYSPVDEGIQEQRALLFDGISSLCSRKKYKAGLLCESIADNSLGGMSLIVSNDAIYHQTSIYKLAADLYEASYKISSRFEARHRQASIEQKNTDEEYIFLKYADPEAMFRYARIALDGRLGDSLKDKGMSLLKASADRGHPESCAEYGGHLYDQADDYEGALRYLEEGADKDMPLSYVGLWLFYTDGKACSVDHDLAFKWLNIGVEVGCPDALACLGISYHEGIYYQKDDEKAETLLKKAIEKGSRRAYDYYVITFNDLKGKMVSHFKEIGERLIAIEKESKQKPIKKERAKVGPNEPCPCGSNKKYKKCCRDKPRSEMTPLFPPFRMN